MRWIRIRVGKTKDVCLEVMRHIVRMAELHERTRGERGKGRVARDRLLSRQLPLGNKVTRRTHFTVSRIRPKINQADAIILIGRRRN